MHSRYYSSFAKWNRKCNTFDTWFTICPFSEHTTRWHRTMQDWLKPVRRSVSSHSTFCRRCSSCSSTFTRYFHCYCHPPFFRFSSLCTDSPFPILPIFLSSIHRHNSSGQSSFFMNINTISSNLMQLSAIQSVIYWLQFTILTLLVTDLTSW